MAGLDTDFRGEPFGPMPDLLAISEFVTKLQAICLFVGHLPVEHNVSLTESLHPLMILLF
ncbi:hypothetical protein [Gracilibacillus sp. JCM 18860]|uniref:hypothetical protein n=1 Tax=Gracilibacillus sp. JCM 18860 TaxID=1306159 RepID=UPI00326067F5